MSKLKVPLYLTLLLLFSCKKSEPDFSDIKVLSEHKAWVIESAEFKIIKAPIVEDIESEQYSYPKPEDYHFDILKGGKLTYTDTAFDLTFIKNSIVTKRSVVDRISIYLDVDMNNPPTNPLIKKEYHLTNHKDVYGVEYTYPMVKIPDGFLFTPITNWNNRDITVQPKAYVKKIKGSKNICLYLPCAEIPYNLNNMGEIKLILKPND